MDKNLRVVRVAGCAALIMLAGQSLGQGVTATLPPGTRAIETKKRDAWQAKIDGELVPAPAVAMGDQRSIELILAAGRDGNRVMEHLTYLSNSIGHRLTGSTNGQRASEWTMQQFASFGLSNPHLHKWGEVAMRFDRGPSSVQLGLMRNSRRGEGDEETTSREWSTIRDLEFTTLSWTHGTEGDLQGPVIAAPTTEEEYAKVQGKLKGAWVLIKSPPPAGRRGVQERMSTSFSNRLEASQQVMSGQKDPEEIALPYRMMFDGILGYISASRDDLVRTSGAPGWQKRSLRELPKQPGDLHIMVRRSDYDAINSRLADGEAIEIKANLQHTLSEGPFPVYNTVADVPGTEKKDELVICSAHLDSWDGPGSQGTTDNGTGSSVMLEAARILQSAIAAGATPPKRTIRFILWTGEEQGLLGSKGYVDEFKEMLQAKASACFVDDGGTNYQGGLAVPKEQVEYLAAATAPTNNVFFDPVDKQYLNVNIRPGGKLDIGGSSDHASFNRIGVPGFFWDEVGRNDYGYGWHTQNDKLERAIETYLKQSATNMAITAYNLACAPELLPRKVEEKKEEKPSEAPVAAPAGAGAGVGAGAGAQTGSGG
jgi:carboxypeptidase Q